MTFRSRRRIAASRAQPVPVGRGAPRGACRDAGAAPRARPATRQPAAPRTAGCLARSRPPARMSGTSAPPARRSAMSWISLASSGSRSTVSTRLAAPHAGRASSSSGRARQRRKSGSRAASARYSIRSRNVASAQCTSSRTTTSGCRSATASKKRRIAGKSSSGRVGPGSARWRLRSEPRCARRRPRRSEPASESTRAPPASSSTTSRSGQNVTPSPYAGQRSVDPRTGAERGGNLPTQPRFSDPCIAKDGEAVSRAVTNSSLEPGHDAGEVGVSSDHRRVQMTRERLSTGNEADEPPGSGRQRVYGLEQRRASEVCLVSSPTSTSSSAAARWIVAATCTA